MPDEVYCLCGFWYGHPGDCKSEVNQEMPNKDFFITFNGQYLPQSNVVLFSGVKRLPRDREYRYCGTCKADRLHIIERYSRPSPDLRLYSYTCLFCHTKGRE